MSVLRYCSEYEHDGYLRVNSCCKQWLSDRNYDIVIPNGRIDFSVRYVLKGLGYCEIDGEMVNLNDYLLACLEEDIREKVNDLVNILIQSKYGSITFYYDQLFNSILNEYKNNKMINKDSMKLCIEIMNNYYDGVICIDNVFNI